MLKHTRPWIVKSLGILLFLEGLMLLATSPAGGFSGIAIVVVFAGVLLAGCPPE